MKNAILIIMLTLICCKQPDLTPSLRNSYFEGSWVSDSKPNVYNQLVNISFVINPDSSLKRVSFHEGNEYMINSFTTWDYKNDTLTFIDEAYASTEKYAIKIIDDNTFEGYTNNLGVYWAVWSTFRRK